MTNVVWRLVPETVSFVRELTLATTINNRPSNLLEGDDGLLSKVKADRSNERSLD